MEYDLVHTAPFGIGAELMFIGILIFIIVRKIVGVIAMRADSWQLAYKPAAVRFTFRQLASRKAAA